MTVTNFTRRFLQSNHFPHISGDPIRCLKWRFFSLVFIYVCIRVGVCFQPLFWLYLIPSESMHFLLQNQISLNVDIYKLNRYLDYIFKSAVNLWVQGFNVEIYSFLDLGFTACQHNLPIEFHKNLTLFLKSLSLPLNNTTYDLIGMIYETLGYSGLCRFISLSIGLWQPVVCHVSIHVS
jgi:hypothetical protein